MCVSVCVHEYAHVFLFCAKLSENRRNVLGAKLVSIPGVVNRLSILTLSHTLNVHSQFILFDSVNTRQFLDQPKLRVSWLVTRRRSSKDS